MRNRVLADKLKYIAHLQKPIQTPNNYGGFDLTFETIATFWCGIENENAYIKAVRGESISAGVTHILIARWMALKNIGKQFNSAFNSDFDSIKDINFLKNNYFIFLQERNSNEGRRFRIEGMSRDEMFKNYVRIQTHLIEEIGTGASE